MGNTGSAFIPTVKRDAYSSGMDVLSRIGLAESSDDVRRVAELQLQQAIKLISPSTAYDEAAQLHPLLLTQETPFIDFLRAAHFHPWLAAHQLAGYWEIRRKVFGTRAFRPMVLDHERSALTGADLKWLRTSVVQLTRGEQRPAIVIDGQALSTEDQSTAQRCLFYMLHVAASLEEVSQQGVNVILFGADRCDALDSPGFLNLFASMPFSIHSLHLVSTTEAPAPSALAANVECYQHWGAREEWLDALNPLGVRPCHVPPFSHELGAERQAWFTEQEQRESYQQAASLATSDTADSDAASANLKMPAMLRRDSLSSTDSRYKQRPMSEADVTSEIEALKSAMPEDGEDRAEFIRKRNALYSRRKYHRKKIEIEVLRSQAAELKKQNDGLQVEGDRLEGLVHQAYALVQSETGVSPPKLKKATHKRPRRTTPESKQSTLDSPQGAASPAPHIHLRESAESQFQLGLAQRGTPGSDRTSHMLPPIGLTGRRAHELEQHLVAGLQHSAEARDLSSVLAYSGRPSPLLNDMTVTELLHQGMLGVPHGLNLGATGNEAPSVAEYLLSQHRSLQGGQNLGLGSFALGQSSLGSLGQAPQFMAGSLGIEQLLRNQRGSSDNSPSLLDILLLQAANRGDDSETRR